MFKTLHMEAALPILARSVDMKVKALEHQGTI